MKKEITKTSPCSDEVSFGGPGGDRRYAPYHGESRVYHPQLVVAYHQCGALYIIKPQNIQPKRADEIQGRCAALDDMHVCDVMIYQACGLDKKIPRNKFSVFFGGICLTKVEPCVTDRKRKPYCFSEINAEAAVIFKCTVCAGSKIAYVKHTAICKMQIVFEVHIGLRPNALCGAIDILRK